MDKSRRTIRQIKLQPRYQVSSSRQTRIVPSLTISGSWLEEMGFKTGSRVIITVEQNQLTIKALHP